ncbi:MAG TPA: hypothetical protein VGL89_06750 [Candidatus Koribacter sp.]|jgi:hypothetical protein
MCYLLFARTTLPLVQKEWRKETTEVCAAPLNESEYPVAGNFAPGIVQVISSTSGCGCYFPFVEHQRGAWRWDDDLDDETIANEQINREGLARLLQTSEEDFVELYGCWIDKVREPIQDREQVTLNDIVQSSFRFRELVLYRVSMRSTATTGE